MKEVLPGGHEQGTLMGWPFAPFTAPSQSPVPDIIYVSNTIDVEQGQNHLLGLSQRHVQNLERALDRHLSWHIPQSFASGVLLVGPPR
jgi:hypothetical protein